MKDLIIHPLFCLPEIDYDFHILSVTEGLKSIKKSKLITVMEKKMFIHKSKKFIYNHYIIFLIPLIALLLIESIHRGNIIRPVTWMIQEPKEAFLSYLLYLAVFSFFYVKNQKLYLWISFGTLMVLSLMAFISRVKFKYRGVPLHPGDFKLIREAISLRDYLYTAIDLKFLTLTIGVMTVFTVILYKVKRERLISVKMSLAIVTLSMAILFSFLIEEPFSFKKWGNLSTFPYAQAKHYDVNGFSLGLVLISLYDEPLDVGKGYTEEKVLELKKKIGQSNETVRTESDFKPNVLYILSESFWDPTIINGLKLSKDPIPFYRKLRKESIHGELIVPVFGGNTGNSEFEALTGMSLWFLGGSHVIPFNEGIEQPVDSIASILSRQGYVATAMHPFNMGYYNRYETYRELGFQKYIPPEYMYNREIRGKYVSDYVLMNQVIEEIKNNEQPVFVHAVTMENHGPYDGNRYQEHTIGVEGPLSKENKTFTEDYLQGLAWADSSLEYLIHKLEKIEEPTVVVFFGDHLPYLGKFEAYKEMGFIDSENLDKYEDFMRIHTTPFLIWNNFKKETKKLRMSLNFLTPYVLEFIGKPGNTLTNYLQLLMKQGITVTPSPEFYEQEGVNAELLEPYKLLQYDSLSGNQYAYDKGIIVEQDDFHYGSGKMSIKGAKRKDSRLEILGENLVPACKVYINGKEVDTTYINPQELVATIPAHESKKLKVEVVIIDEWSKEVLEKTVSIMVE